MVADNAIVYDLEQHRIVETGTPKRPPTDGIKLRSKMADALVMLHHSPDHRSQLLDYSAKSIARLLELGYLGGPDHHGFYVLTRAGQEVAARTKWRRDRCARRRWWR